MSRLPDSYGELMDCRDENLRALCQKCHLGYDAKLHARNAAETRRKRQLAAGELFANAAPGPRKPCPVCGTAIRLASKTCFPCRYPNAGKHGVRGTYINHGCRCDRCKEANKFYARDRYGRGLSQ